KQFFDEVERYRYEAHPFMHRLIGFDRAAGKSVLEVGCGLGTDLLQFARAGARVVGVDLTPASVVLVQRRFALEMRAGNVLVADAENLPFSDGSYDTVYSFGVLHHTPHTQKAIDEIYRVLKPGGEAIVMLYHKMSLHVMLGVPLYRLFGSHKRSHLGITADWIRRYDGTENPLGKAYSRREARSMFSRFGQVDLVLCDPIRRRFPAAVNWMSQHLFARILGFYMIIRAHKNRSPAAT
ncbi:MAG: class I SAM-dependent methyltransferase, partial [Ignavibacteriales bacterium]|nr:class I SAM-dependent methyltransferase [Ignavibacteriales bacterium]